MRISPRFALPGLVLLSACGTRPPSAAGPGRDSAGITIVENPTPLGPDSVALRPDSAPAVDLGGGRDAHGDVAGGPGGRRRRWPSGGAGVLTANSPVSPAGCGGATAPSPSPTAAARRSGSSIRPATGSARSGGRAGVPANSKGSGRFS